MTSIAFRASAHTTPSWPRLVGIQVGLIARSGRWIELIGGAAALYVLALLGPTIGDVHGLANDERVWGQWALYCLPLVAIWPSLLWRGEGFGRRYYHWSLPVPHGLHDLARITAGALWVVGVIAMLAAGNYVSVWPVEMMAHPQAISEVMTYAVGLLTLYCVASVLTLVVAHSARWFFGILTAYLLLWAPLSLPPVPRALYRAWAAPIVGRYGLYWATLGAGSSGDAWTEESDHTVTTSPGDKVVLTLTITDSTTAAPGKAGAEQRVENLEFPGPHWKWGASAVWLVGSIGVMLLISARRRER